VRFIDSVNSITVISLGINPVKGGRPPRDNSIIIVAELIIVLWAESLFMCLVE